MTFFLDGADPDLPALGAPIPGYGEAAAASYHLDHLTSNAWLESARYQGAVEDEILAKLGPGNPVLQGLARESPEYRRRVAVAGGDEAQVLAALGPDNPLWNQLARRSPQYHARLMTAAGESAARDPAGWGSLPKTEEEFTAEWERRQRQDFDGYEALLANSPAGRWGAQSLGSLGAGIVDPVTIATAPFGVPGRLALWARMLGEGAINAAGTAVTLPQRNAQADALGIERPSAAAEIAVSGLIGGGLAGVMEGAVRGLGYLATKRAAAQASRPAGQPSALDWESDVAAAAEQLAADREAAGAAAAPGSGQPEAGGAPVDFGSFDYSAAGNASPGGNRIGYVFGKLVGLGYEPHIAAGIVGNLVQESGPSLNVGAVGDGGAAFGMAQWNGPRKAAYLDFARRQGADPADLDAQIAFLDFEMKGPEAAAWAKVRGARTPEEAALLLSKLFWRPGDPWNQNRVAYAKSVWDQYQGGQVPRWKGANVVSRADAGGAPEAAPGASAAAWGASGRRGMTGDGQVVTGSGQRIDVSYEVVDLSILRQAEGDLQPRDRGRANSDAWVARTAAGLDPALLMPAPTVDRGAPLVGPDGIVESGNGRVLAIGRAYDMHVDRADAYRQSIVAAGFEIPEGVERPVLIARRTTEMSHARRIDLVNEGQDSGVAELTPAERSQAMARHLTPERLDMIDPDVRIGDPRNRRFVLAFADKLPASQVNRLYAGGDLTKEGAREVRQAIFARAWRDRDVIARALEVDELDDDLAGMMRGFERAAPAWAALVGEIEAGRVRPEMDIGPELLDALRIIDAARIGTSGGRTLQGRIDDALAQFDMLSGAVSPLVAALVRKLAPKGRILASEKIGAFLRSYAAEARKAGRADDPLGAGASPVAVLKALDRRIFGDVPEDVARVAPKVFSRPVETPAPVEAGEIPAGAFADGALSPEAEVGDALAMEDLRSESVFGGPVLRGFEGDWRGAVEALKAQKGGEAPGALRHRDVPEPISLVWGEPGTGKKNTGFGLSKILLRHSEVLDDLQARLDAAHVVSASENRIRLENETDSFSVSRAYKGNKVTWLLTAYDRSADRAMREAEGQGAGRSMIRPGDRPEAASASALSERKDSTPSAPDQSRPAPDGEPDLAALDPREAEARLVDAQPFDDVDGLYRLAPEAQHAFEQFMGGIASRHEGVIWKNPGLKKRGTVEEKLVRKRYKSVRQLTDVVRGGVVVPTAEAADAVVADFAGRFTLIDGGWVRNDFGFVDRKLTVRMPNGVVAEVQIWAGPMYEAKATKGQALYTEARSSSDPARIDALREESIALYSAAGAAAGPSFERAAGTSSGPKVFSKRSDSASAEPRTAPDQATSSASTETQGPPGSSMARASVDENSTAGRRSQSQNTGYSDGIAKNPDSSDSKDIGDRPAFANPAALDGEPDPEGDAIRAMIADLRADDAIEIPLPDGSTKSISVAELLDDIEEDMALEEVIRTCGLGSGGGGTGGPDA